MSTFNLVMTFLNASGKNSTITLKNVKPALTKEEIQTAMDAVITNNIFETPLGDLVSVKSAVIVETAKNILI